VLGPLAPLPFIPCVPELKACQRRLLYHTTRILSLAVHSDPKYTSQWRPAREPGDGASCGDVHLQLLKLHSLACQSPLLQALLGLQVTNVVTPVKGMDRIEELHDLSQTPCLSAPPTCRRLGTIDIVTTGGIRGLRAPANALY